MNVYRVCRRCNACCRWPGDVRLREGELDRIARFLGIDPREAADRFTRLTRDRRALSLAEKEDGSCIFLEEDGCRIHEVKPRQCREFPNGWNFPGFEKVCASVPVPAGDVAASDAPGGAGDGGENEERERPGGTRRPRSC